MTLALRTRLETKEGRNDDDENDSPIDELKSALDERDGALTKRIGDLEKKLADEKNRGDRLETALKRSPRGGVDDDRKTEPTREDKSFSLFLRRGVEGMTADEQKALVVGDNVQGGYLASPEMAREILKDLVPHSPIRDLARVATMAKSEMVLPKKTNAGDNAAWVGELQDRPETESEYGQIIIPAHEVSAFSDVSTKALEDADFNLQQEIGADVSEDFGRKESTAFVWGDGNNKPRGFLTYESVPAIASGHATQITADGLIDFFYRLPEHYRSSATWLMAGQTLAAIRKLKDGTGQYLWAPGIAVGQPQTILGTPVRECVDMPPIGAGTFPVALGDWRRAYRIFDRVGFTMLRDPYTRARNGIVRFWCRRRVGGACVMPTAIRKLKIAETL